MSKAIITSVGARDDGSEDEGADELAALIRLWRSLGPCLHSRLLTIAQENCPFEIGPEQPTRH
jgi:hypothetical protein